MLRIHCCPENDYEPILETARKKNTRTIAMRAFAEIIHELTIEEQEKLVESAANPKPIFPRS